MNSSWGVIFQVVKETGWSWHYVLWKISWFNIQMMIKDQPSYIPADPDDDCDGGIANEDSSDVLDFLKDF